MDSPYLRRTGFVLDIKFTHLLFTEQGGTAICGKE